MSESTFTPLKFTDIQSGLDYLSGLSLAHPALAEQQLLRFIDSLLAEPPDPGILLTLLEQARVPLCFVEEEMAREYHNKALVLSESEESSFQQVITAWRKMGKAYAMCAQMETPDWSNPKYAGLMASILHRCIYYTGMVILEHYRARRELPAGIWLDLHGFFETAEEWGVACSPVVDGLENTLQATHCSAAYTTLLLIDIASPYSNTVRDLNLIRRWAGMWAPLVSVLKLDDDLEIPPYIVELMRDNPLHPSALSDSPAADTRRLDTTRLGLQINHLLSQLQQQMTPSQLGLGEETSGHVTKLLQRLTLPWTQSASPRKFRRFSSEGVARIAIGFDAMHFHITGKEFSQPAIASTYSRGEFDQIFTFGDRAHPEQELVIKPGISFPIDEWSVINHSANGFRLGSRHPAFKIRHGQLIVVCPHDGEQFLLAQTNWLMQEESGGLIVGVATLPGVPTGVGVRYAGLTGEHGDKLVPAFLLPPLPTLREEGSIVLASALFQANRILDVFQGVESFQIRLRHVVQRGADFDRANYQRL